PEDSGWNNLAAGLKYVVIADTENQFALTAGARIEFASGQKKILQGGVDEFSPFVSVAKGWDRFHLLANVSPRFALDGGDGNNVFQWSLHADYEIFKGVAPLIELHGLHYLDNGDRTPLPIGGLDYTNLGSTDVSGNHVYWLGLGGEIKLTPNVCVGATYEFALTDPKDDIMDNRMTFSLHLTW
ncbi:MAG TPA: hypothetical protein VG711_06230, partial [Phycisphaerales bacterium]|nr:hypothetical protein [Phycisphaerales bacterium]